MNWSPNPESKPVKLLKRNDYFTIVLAILHTVGFVGLISPYQSYFLLLTPINLVVSLTLLIWAQRGKNQAFWITAGVVYLVGFFVEVAGVNTGLIFGTYSYGETLGPKWLATPWVIGVNWLLLIMACGSAASRVPLPWYLKVLTGALLMVLLDLAIEPVAIVLDFWDWPGGSIPVQNYLAWFGISLVLLSLYFRLPFPKANKVAASLYIIQLLFFIALNLALV